MSEYKPYIDENGRLYLFSLCDGTPDIPPAAYSLS